MTDLIGRTGRRGNGQVLVALDDEWLAVWNEAGQYFYEPERIQTFLTKTFDDVLNVSNPDEVLAEIVAIEDVPEVPIEVLAP
jgi:hypothetical protein